MITILVKKEIKDSSVNRNRLVNETFKISKERYREMKDTLKNLFDLYFQIIEIKK